ncbi:Protein-export membrane protein SecF [Chitinispirillum alkaliphilum]|nr:Protein-export membrane protein SecF [Chitinispirillum alkaliphilum]
MQFLKKSNFNILGHAKIAITISLAIIAVTLVSFFYPGFNLSIDFAGGTLVQMKFEEPVQQDIATIRELVNDLGFGQAEIRTIGFEQDNEIQITVKAQMEGSGISDEIRNTLTENYSQNPFEVRREESVGMRIGGEFRRNTIIAVLVALLAILIYVGFRFSLPFGVASVVPLFHDVLITLGIFTIFGMELSLSFFAALLTVVGYSLNDTIVILDRVRENIKKSGRGKDFKELINSSINQTLSRTIITSITTLFVVTSLYILGSEIIRDFALVLLIGVIVGTYSTLFVASPVLVWWNKKWPILKK